MVTYKTQTIFIYIITSKSSINVITTSMALVDLPILDGFKVFQAISFLELFLTLVAFASILLRHCFYFVYFVVSHCFCCGYCFEVFRSWTFLQLLLLLLSSFSICFLFVLVTAGLFRQTPNIFFLILYKLILQLVRVLKELVILTLTLLYTSESLVRELLLTL